MDNLTIKELNKDLIHQANCNSMSGARGDLRNKSYQGYCSRVLEWKISDEKRQKIFDKLYEKCSQILCYEAQHVSWAVAGPAKYNARKLDKSDKILSLSAELSDWFEGLEKQLEQSKNQVDEVQCLVEMAEFCDSRSELRPDSSLMKLATLDKDKFIELFERMQPKYKWRKNSNLYKLYAAAKDGTLKVIRKEVFYENADFTAYRKGDRAYIKFVIKPARQLIVALKSRGWWWNNHEDAWSTYLNKVDEEWVKEISTRYAKYV